MSDHLNSDDFEHLQDRQGAEYWRAKQLVDSPFGKFLVRLTTAPYDELVQTANVLIELLTRDHQTILNRTFALYQLVAEDKRWMKERRVPHDLEIDQVMAYVRNRIISVRRDPQGRVDGSISMRAKWDDEHLISFDLENGRLVCD